MCSVHFEGGLGPTKLNPIPTVFIFPHPLQPKTNNHWTRRSGGKKRKSSNYTVTRTETAQAKKARTTVENKENEEQNT